jgi:hypothetical protein
MLLARSAMLESPRIELIKFASRPFLPSATGLLGPLSAVNESGPFF